MEYSFNAIMFFLPLMLIVCLFVNKISIKVGFPAFIAFLIVGMLFGEEGPFHIPYDNYNLTKNVCDFAVGIITFVGGFETKFNKTKKILPQAIILSTIGVIGTAIFLGYIIHIITNIDLSYCLIIGAVLGSTDATSVFNVLRKSKLNLKYNTASLLEVESGSNDPMAYTLTTIFILSYLGSKDGGVKLFITQYIIGLLIGLSFGIIIKFVLSKIKFEDDTANTLLLVLLIPIIISLSAKFKANNLLALYIMGIILGNSYFSNKKYIVNFLDSVTSLSQMIIFFLMGLLISPHLLATIIPEAIIIFLLLTFLVRPICVFLLMSPFKSNINQMIFVSAAGLRGASSLIFAIYMYISIVNDDTKTVFGIIFLVVVLSLLLQGEFLPILAKKIDMIDDTEDVLKTFTDYEDNNAVCFMRMKVDKNSIICDKKIKDITIPSSRIALVLRGKEKILPKGDLTLLDGDTVVLSGQKFDSTDDFSFKEIVLSKSHPYANKAIKDIDFGENQNVLMICRDENVALPDGDQVLRVGDTIIVSTNIQST